MTYLATFNSESMNKTYEDVEYSKVEQRITTWRWEALRKNEEFFFTITRTNINNGKNNDAECDSEKTQEH